MILTLGLGIGANAAMFGVIDRLMFRPFPYLRDPAAVNRVYLQTTARGRVNTRSTFPYPRYLDLRALDDLVLAVRRVHRMAAGRRDGRRRSRADGVPASTRRSSTSSTRSPSLGRFFDAAEDVVPRGANVAVLGYGYWKTEFGGRDVLGQTLQVGPLVTTIIGVAPEGFVGVVEGEPPAVFIPITTFAYGVNQGNPQTFATRYNWDWMSVMVRRKPGVTPAAATADLTNAFIRSRNAQRS